MSQVRARLLVDALAARARASDLSHSYNLHWTTSEQGVLLADHPGSGRYQTHSPTLLSCRARTQAAFQPPERRGGWRFPGVARGRRSRLPPVVPRSMCSYPAVRPGAPAQSLPRQLSPEPAAQDGGRHRISRIRLGSVPPLSPTARGLQPILRAGTHVSLCLISCRIRGIG